MTLIVEDGTGLATAESYASVASLDAYAAAHGSPAAWTAAGVVAKEAALRYASTWVDGRYLWRGIVLRTTQRLSWPRSGAVDPDGRELTGVPARLVELVCQAALEHLVESLTAPAARGGAVASERVGSLEVSYFPGAPGGRSFSYLDDLADPLTSDAGRGHNVVSLVRT